MRAAYDDRMRAFAPGRQRKVSPVDSVVSLQGMIAAAAGAIEEIVAMRGVAAGVETASKRDSQRPFLVARPRR